MAKYHRKPWKGACGYSESKGESQRRQILSQILVLILISLFTQGKSVISFNLSPFVKSEL